MNTKKVEYLAATGYDAIVSDIEELLGGNSFTKSIGDSNTTTFIAPGGGDSRVGLRILRTSTNYIPSMLAYLNNGSVTYTAGGIGNTMAKMSVAYAYGDGFLVACCGASALPCADNTSYGGNCTVGVVQGKNIMTGDTGYCGFSVNPSSYSFFSPDSMTGGSVQDPLSTNASIGAAISLHHPKYSWVADNALMLTAIPDALTATLSPVIFNGTPYMRLGRILIPAE